MLLTSPRNPGSDEPQISPMNANGHSLSGIAALIRSRLESAVGLSHRMIMSSVQEIESALTRLSLADLQAVRVWLDDFIEDRMEVSDEFKAKIQRAKEEIADNVYSRTRRPEGAP